jgi:hypothetical protein
VIEDVVTNVRDTFLDEGVDEQVLSELRMLWESKLMNSKAVENGAYGGEVPSCEILIVNIIMRNLHTNLRSQKSEF